jgi:DNA-binding winged helix-turn-helix (wHTH) protein
MIYPPYAAPFPDSNAADITLGNQQRAVLTVLARKPGRVVTSEELAAVVGLPAMTPRRADVVMNGINEVLGEGTIVDVPRRGWMLQPYTDAPVTISF